MSEAAGSRSRPAWVAAALLSLAPLAWAGNMVIGRAVAGAFPPLALNWWRWTVAAAVLSLFVLPLLRRTLPRLTPIAPLLLLLAATGIAGFHSAVYLGLSDTTATNAALIVALGPVLILPLSRLLLGARLGRCQALGILLSCLGVLLVVARGHWQVLARFDFNRGDLWLLLASTLWALYSVLLKRLPEGLPQLAVLLAIMLLGVAMMTPFFLCEMAGGAMPPADWRSFAVVAYVSLVASVLAYICWNGGIAAFGPNVGGLFLHLLPAFAAILAAIFLGESLAKHHLAGIILIATGIGLTLAGRPASS